MTDEMKILLQQYVEKIKRIYGEHLRSVMLYGSYARGDYRSESDIDLMILVDLPVDGIDRYSDALSQLDFEYNVDSGLWFMPIVTNIDHFNYWREALPLYSNISKEGVLLYDAA